MRIAIASPAKSGTRHGNRITALRYAKLLRSLGHNVRMQADSPRRGELLIALHARKSAPIIEVWKRDHQDLPIVVVLTGTDLYEDLPHNRLVLESLQAASRIVVLQPDALRFLPAELASKTTVIIQSAIPPRRRLPRLQRCFEVCVSGHLRDVKDPLRTAWAARHLGVESRIFISQIGACLNSTWRQRVEREVRDNSRFRYFGSVSHWRARQLLARSRLLVISSRSEGAPNVASEAIACRVPILSTQISGMLGLLGPKYPGYFPVGDTNSLASLLSRAENDHGFYQRLKSAINNLHEQVDPRNERATWRRLLNDLDISQT